MARYIEESHLKTVARAFTNQDFRDILDEVLEHTDSADVQPVVRGKWIESHNLDDCFWICSECKFCSMATLAPKLYNYCPNCGAYLKEG